MLQFFKDYAGKVSGHFSDGEFRLGMLFVVVLLLVIAVAVAFFRLRNRRRRAIVISEEGGELVISRRAFCDFVRGVVSEYPLFRLVNAAFVPKDGGFRVKLWLKSSADAELSAQHDMLRQRVVTELQTKLGLGDKVNAVDMVIVALTKAEEAATSPKEIAP